MKRQGHTPAVEIQKSLEEEAVENHSSIQIEQMSL